MPYTKGKNKTFKTSLKNELIHVLNELYQKEFVIDEVTLNNHYIFVLKYSDKSNLQLFILSLHILQANPIGQWLHEQIIYLQLKKLNENYFFISNIATALSYKLIKFTPHLFTPSHSSTIPLKNFINKCHQHILILSEPKDSLDEVIERVLNDEKNLYHTTHLRSTSR